MDASKGSDTTLLGSQDSASPLSMQMSNHVIEKGLDFAHGEGARAGTNAPSSKRSRSPVDELPSKQLRTNHVESTAADSATSPHESVENDEEDAYEDMLSSTTSRPVLTFDILDEVEAGPGEDDEDYNGCEQGSESDISDEEIEAMLEAGLQNRKPEVQEDEEIAHEVKEKVILKVWGHDHFDLLPEGWIQVTHNSGIPVYLHKQSRVCTLSKPYFLGLGSIRKHEVPISAIPCLHYRREKEKEQNNTATNGVAEEDAGSIEARSNPPICVPAAKVESAKESQKERSLDFLAVREYCENLFDFHTVQVKRFKTWAGRRKHKKKMRQMQRPMLPEGTKLITCSLPPTSDTNQVSSGHSKREFIMNPSGKSNVCILHEYVQHAMRTQPQYTFKELESSSMPYGATVVINNIEYGSGFGSSKKQAKSEAARTTLEILIPQMKDVNTKNEKPEDFFQDVAFFDEIRVEDPRVSDLCAKTGQLSPYQILLECIKRNYGMGDMEIKQEMKNMKHQRNEFIMSVGKHTTSVICRNKRDGKQRASQAILQALHPHITSWGSLLRLYGKGSCRTLKEKKEEEQRITELQSKASANKPNLCILNKLKEEMVKLKERQEAMKPIGKFIPKEMELPSASASDLKVVEL
ncbi:microprocessor complex subunit DGCR8-like [Ornithodoros turicata]